MNYKKHKNLITVFVILVILGMVLAYVPLIFYKQTPQSVTSESQTASLTPPITQSTSSAVQNQSGEKEQNQLPAGFSGLEEEGQSLEDINDLLNNTGQ